MGWIILVFLLIRIGKEAYDYFTTPSLPKFRDNKAAIQFYKDSRSIGWANAEKKWGRGHYNK